MDPSASLKRSKNSPRSHWALNLWKEDTTTTAVSRGAGLWVGGSRPTCFTFFPPKTLVYFNWVECDRLILSDLLLKLKKHDLRFLKVLEIDIPKSAESTPKDLHSELLGYLDFD